MQLKTISTLLKRPFSGPAWHGPNMLETLQTITLEKAVKRFGESNNIAELVHHITAWRTFGIKKLEGDAAFDITDDFNFVTYETLSEAEWEGLKTRLQESQNRLLALLSEADESLLEQQVAGRPYNFFTLLHGIIQHDLYHLGQIVLLSKY